MCSRIFSAEAPAQFAGPKQFVRECETLTYQQGIVAATDKSIQGVGLPEMRKGIDAFLDKQKAKPRGP